MKKFFVFLVVMFGVLFGAVADDKKTSGFLYSNYTSEHSVAPYVGSFVVKNNDSQQFYNGISAKLQSSLSSAFGSESLKNWFRHSLIKGEVSEYNIPDFMQIGGNYVSDFVTNKITHNIENLSYVHDINIDIKSSLGDRKWEVALDSIGAVRETDDDIILWNARGFVAQNDTGGGSAGLIYRRNFEQVLLGVNSYLDFENDGDYGSFWRYSSGIEAMGNSWDFSANVYRAITGYKTAIKSGVLSRAYSADGWDAEFNGNLPFYSQLAIGARYYKWQQKYDKNISGLVYSAELNPTNNFHFGVEYDDRQSAKGEWGVYAQYKILFGDKKSSVSASSFVAQNIDSWERRYETPTRRFAQQIVKQATTETIIQNGVRYDMEDIKISPNAITLNAEDIDSLTEASIINVYSNIFSTVELEFLITTSFLNSVTVGAIFIIPESPPTVEFGLYRVVEGIREDNGRIYFATRQAGMAEIITGGRIRIRGSLSEQNQQTPSTQVLAHIPTIQRLRTNQVTPSIISFSGYCNAVAVNLSARYVTVPPLFGACAGLGIDFDGELNMDDGTTNTPSMEFRFNLSGRAAAGLGTNEGVAQIDEMLPLGDRIPLRIPLPIIAALPLYLEAFFIVNAKVETSINTGFTGSLEREFGIGVYPSGVQNLTGPTPPPNFQTIFPELDDEGLPDISLEYNIGPEIRITPLIDPELDDFLSGLPGIITTNIEANVNANLLLETKVALTTKVTTIMSSTLMVECKEFTSKRDLIPSIGAKAAFNIVFWGPFTDTTIGGIDAGGDLTLPGVNINDERNLRCPEDMPTVTMTMTMTMTMPPEDMPTPVTMTMTMEMGDGSGIGITISLSWIDSTDSIVELDLLINSPCQVKPFGLSRRTVTFSQSFQDGGNCFNSEDERIGRAGYRDHLDTVPFKSFVFDNAPTGDYEIFVVTGCYRRGSFLDGGRGRELCISSRAEYNFEVIYGDQRRIISGTYNGLRLANGASLIENALSSIKFRFVNVNPRYCYSFRGTEVCTAPPF